MARESRSDRSAARDEPTGPAIAVEDLTKRYSGANEVVAVDGVSLSVERGSVVGLLGPNGAGKTTAIKSILGVVAPTSGRVVVDGIDVAENPTAVYERVGTVLEGARNVYWRLTVRENLRFFSRLQGHGSAADFEDHEEYLDLLDLREKADELVKNLSRGMKQKVALACAFARKTPILFLDEPTLGLDVEASRVLRERLRELVREEDRTVVISSHDMDSIQKLCDRVVVMNRGEIIADETTEGLVDLFRTQSYRIEVDGELSSAVESDLRERFDVIEWEESADGSVSFEVGFERGNEFYDCTDLLREDGVEPVSIRTVEPDLEDAFLRVVENDDGSGTSQENVAPATDGGEPR